MKTAAATFLAIILLLAPAKGQTNQANDELTNATSTNSVPSLPSRANQNYSQPSPTGPDFARYVPVKEQASHPFEFYDTIQWASLLLTIGGVIAVAFFARHHREKMLHQTLRSMIERGMPVTPELIGRLGRRGFHVDIQGKLNGKSRNRHLLSGLILTAIGLPLIIALPEHSGPCGLIILFIGLAFLIVWLVERKQYANDERSGNVRKEGVEQPERKQDNDQQPPKI